LARERGGAPHAPWVGIAGWLTRVLRTARLDAANAVGVAIGARRPPCTGFWRWTGSTTGVTCRCSQVPGADADGVTCRGTCLQGARATARACLGIPGARGVTVAGAHIEPSVRALKEARCGRERAPLADTSGVDARLLSELVRTRGAANTAIPNTTRVCIARLQCKVLGFTSRDAQGCGVLVHARHIGGAVACASGEICNHVVAAAVILTLGIDKVPHARAATLLNTRGGICETVDTLVLANR
jgi:hypothetical protein